MSDSQRLLELIETCVIEHGGDLGGWSRRIDDRLQLFDGRVTLRAELKDAGPSPDDGLVHAHVLITLHDYDDEILDACLFGIGNDREEALSQVALIWMTSVAGPIKSFIDNKPVCMTCQAGVQGGNASEGYSESDYGLPDLRAFVGPALSRGFNDERVQSAIDGTQPWFRFAAESAAPRRVHLAKASIISKGKDGWRRELEIDGHDVSHHDPDWPAGVQAPDFGYLTRFAVFEFPRNSSVIHLRAKLEETIRHFAENFAKYDSADLLMNEMLSQGFDPDHVHETESISTIAFGRALFEHHGVQYSSTVIRARRDGRVQADVPLMSIPAYSRARALAVQLRETMPENDFQALCLYNAESHAIVKAIEANGDNLDLTKIKLYPCVVPDRGVSDQTMDAALAMLNMLIERNRSTKKKPWWKFW
ncbi:hypothetical protein V5E97_25305 [Singulisphaera sp. Ch08]|uniref:Uncharacterized protein n=1 Tax=Singulisphaera sp. Ch08 TaxID=3120278 RepID=A0AAU7C960_9BACT